MNKFPIDLFLYRTTRFSIKNTQAGYCGTNTPIFGLTCGPFLSRIVNHRGYYWLFRSKIKASSAGTSSLVSSISHIEYFIKKKNGYYIATLHIAHDEATGLLEIQEPTVFSFYYFSLSAPQHSAKVPDWTGSGLNTWVQYFLDTCFTTRSSLFN